MHTLKPTIIALSLLISSTAFAKEVHVAKNGNDANKGTLAMHFKTIAAAVAVAYAGDTNRTWRHLPRVG